MSRIDTDNETPGGLNLAERIRRLANGRTSLDVAQFQFVGIAEIRARYGARWTEKRDRVAQVARHFISRRIAPDDVLVAGADGFLLVFGSFTGVLADLAAQRISKDLNAFFLGDPDLEDVTFDAQHQAMSVADFVQAFGAMISATRDHIPQTSRTTGDVAMAWTPVWDARRGVLATYFITPMDAATQQPLDWDYQSHRHVEMDERKLTASETAMQTLFAGEGRSLAGVAVHASSLNNQQSLARLVQAMARFDRKMARYRVLRVSCVEPGYPRIYLEDIMRSIRPHVARVAIGLNWMEPDVGSVLRLQPAAIGFAIPQRVLEQPATQAEMFARVAGAVEQARGYGVMVGVEGDLQPEHAQRFAQDGVTYICSPRIWPMRATLPHAEAWPQARLTAMVAAASAA
jgi:hypothetical protein